jgi:hypothetical protein
VFDGQYMCINACWWIHVHLRSWHSVWWSVFLYQYLLSESINKHWYTYTDHQTLCQGFNCTWIYQQVLIHIYRPSNTVSRFKSTWFHKQVLIHIHWPWNSVRWSVYVYQCLFMNSRTFNTLTECSMVSVCVSILVDKFKYVNFKTFINKNWYAYTDHQTLCQVLNCTWIHQQALIHIHWPPITVSMF